ENRLKTQADAAQASGQSAAEQTQWLFGLAVLLTVLIVVPLTVLNMLSICRPLQQAKTLADAIAQGDLTQQLQVQGRDEVAELQKSLQAMQQQLNRLISQVRDACSNIATASQEI